MKIKKNKIKWMIIFNTRKMATKYHKILFKKIIKNFFSGNSFGISYEKKNKT